MAKKKTDKSQGTLEDGNGPLVQKCPAKLKKILVEMFDAKRERGELLATVNDAQARAVDYMKENDLQMVCVELSGGDRKNFSVNHKTTIKSSKPKKEKEHDYSEAPA